MDYISFDELRRSAESRWPEPIETSLLGDVPWKHDRASGKMTGVIPEWITIGAAKHGLEVLVADFRRGTYSFRLCEPHKSEFTGLRGFLRRSGGMIGWASVPITTEVLKWK